MIRGLYLSILLSLVAILSLQIAFAQTINSVSTVNPTCNGGSNGSLTINVTGGTLPYQYSIDNGVNFQAGNSFTGLSAGSYDVVVEDAISGQDNATSTLNNPALITFTSVVSAENCGAGDGSITLTGGGGDGGPYTYSNDGGTTFQASGTFTGLTVGHYNIVVEDASGCQVSGNEVVSGTGGPAITNISVDVALSCFGDCNGQLTATVTGGTPPYTYAWTDAAGNSVGGNSATVTGLCADFYTVEVTDATSGSTTFWTENFGTANCTNRNQLATAASSPNGSWTQTITAAEAGVPNQWFVSSTEAFTGAGNCGDGCIGNAALDNQSLHVGSLGVGLCPAGDCGASYNAGANGETHKRIESPTINCTGQSNIQISFEYMMFGELNTDAASLAYFNGASWTNLVVPLPQTTCCGGPCGSLLAQGQWSPTKYTATLPVSANNNANVRIGFVWDNNGNNSGSDPSFAADEIELSSITTGTCPTAMGINLTEPAAVSFMATVVDSDCASSTGQITLTASGGDGGPYSYSNDNGVTFQGSSIFTGLAGANYNVIIEDGSGCQSSTQLILVGTVDTGPPVITCPGNQNVNFNGSCQYSLLDYTSTPVTSDNCSGSITVTQSPAMGTLISTTQTITLTADDGAGNTSTCTFDVIPADNTNPTITCPGNQNVNFDASCQYALLDYTGMAAVSDNCAASPTVTQSPAMGTVISTTQTITLTATDDNSNTATCTFDVIPSDAIPPNAVCQNISVYIDGTGNVSITGADVDGGSTDECGIVSLSASPNTFTCANLGTNNVVLTAFDGVNNGTCNSTVTVLDTISPTITCPGNQIENFDASCQFTLPDYTSLVSGNDNCGSVVVTQVPAALTVISSNTTITMTATDPSGNTATCTFDVIANDATPPNAVCQNISVYLDGTGNASITGADVDGGSTDNCGTVNLSASPNTFTCANLGANNVVLTASDGVNSNTCNSTVTVLDTIAPTITCPGNINQNNDAGQCGATVTYSAPVGTDNCSGAITAQTAGLASGSLFPVGTTTNTFEVTDGAGNTSSCSFDVTITDAENPTITCPGILTQNNDAGQCGAVVIYTAPVGTDNCSGASTTQTAGMASGSLFPVGTTTNTFEVTDGAGNTSTCSFDVTINDTENPTITCSGNIQSCDSVLSVPDPTISDNCSGSTFVLSSGLASGSTFPVTTTTNVYTVTDASGNTATCSVDITRFALPAVDAGPDLTVGLGNSIQIDASSSNVQTYSWSPSGDLNDPTIEDPTAAPMQTTTYTVTVTSPDGCTASDNMTINIEEAIEINNFMSPNGDGKNDTWQIRGNQLLANCTVQVFDSWGNLIFEGTGYNNDWDGTKSGDELPEGNYFYAITCGTDEPITGSITLIR